MDINKKYEIIIKSICEFKGIEKNELMSILSDKNCRYLLFLMMKKYKCNYTDRVKENLNINSSKTINSNIKRAKEKFLINRNFRDDYFEVNNLIEKNIEEGGRKIS